MVKNLLKHKAAGSVLLVLGCHVDISLWTDIVERMLAANLRHHCPSDSPSYISLKSSLRAPHMVQVQLGEVFKCIVYADYPDKWPGLLPMLYSNLNSQVRSLVAGSSIKL